VVEQPDGSLIQLPTWMTEPSAGQLRQVVDPILPIPSLMALRRLVDRVLPSWCASCIPAFLYGKKPLFGLIWP